MITIRSLQPPFWRRSHLWRPIFVTHASILLSCSLLAGACSQIPPPQIVTIRSTNIEHEWSKREPAGGRHSDNLLKIVVPQADPKVITRTSIVWKIGEGKEGSSDFGVDGGIATAQIPPIPTRASLASITILSSQMNEAPVKLLSHREIGPEGGAALITYRGKVSTFFVDEDHRLWSGDFLLLEYYPRRTGHPVTERYLIQRTHGVTTSSDLYLDRIEDQSRYSFLIWGRVKHLYITPLLLSDNEVDALSGVRLKWSWTDLDFEFERIGGLPSNGGVEK